MSLCSKSTYSYKKTVQIPIVFLLLPPSKSDKSKITGTNNFKGAESFNIFGEKGLLLLDGANNKYVLTWGSYYMPDNKNTYTIISTAQTAII